MRAGAIALLAAVLGSAGAIAEEPPVEAAPEPCLTADGEAVLTGIDETLTATLDDGRRVRLADVAAAAAPPSLTGAVAVLRATAEPDRYGRVVGDLVLKATGASVRVELIKNGLAFVDPAVMSGACLQALFAAERSAETDRRGVWADSPVISADSPALAAAAGRIVIVDGTVKTIGETRQTIYLNFGYRYRTDFTVIVRKRDARGWDDAARALEGRRVRVRGLLEAWNGGLIRVEHPAQIDALAGAQGGVSPSR